MARPLEHEGFDPTELIEKYQKGIWRYLRALGCDSAEADDLTQETFLAFLRHPFEYLSDAATAGYLRRIAYNQFVSVRRRAGRVIGVENIEEFDRTWEQWTDGRVEEDLLDTLRECLQELTERARMALEMRFRDCESRANIAAALEITEHGARNLMQRAKKQLRVCIESKNREQ